MTYFFLFFKRNDILVDVIIFAKDKAENQKKFCKRKMEENMEKNKIKKIALIFNILQVKEKWRKIWKKIKSKK